MKYKLKTPSGNPSEILQYIPLSIGVQSRSNKNNKNTNYNLKKNEYKYVIKNIILTHINKSKKHTTPHTINKKQNSILRKYPSKNKNNKKELTKMKYKNNKIYYIIFTDIPINYEMNDDGVIDDIHY